MIRCSHCGYRNNNAFYCAGCGRRSMTDRPLIEREAALERPAFLAALTGALDRIFPVFVEEPVMSQAAMPTVDIAPIVAEDGMVLSGNTPFRFIDGRRTAQVFFGDMLVDAGVAAMFAFAAHFFDALSFLGAVKMYFAVFLILSWMTWWLFPYLIGALPVSLVRYGIRVVKDDGSPVRGDLVSPLLLWLVALAYSLFPLIIAEYLYLMVARDHYRPLLFQVAGVRSIRPA